MESYNQIYNINIPLINIYLRDTIIMIFMDK